MKKINKKNFTLLEVAVVLLVVVALAGLVAPLALGYGQRSHGSTGAGNMAQLLQNINRFEVENFAYPDNWDNLVDTAGTDLYIPGTTGLSVAPLGAGELASLAEAGIANVHALIDVDPVAAGDQYSTFNGTDATATALTDTTPIVEIAASEVQDLLGSSNSATDRYVVFGIGERLSAVGRTLSTVPYDFPEGSESPEEEYKRFLAVFNVSGERARLVGIIANDEGTLTNIQTHIEEYYEASE